MRDLQPARVFGVGELLWDLLERGKQLGGAATNFIYFTTAMDAQDTIGAGDSFTAAMVMGVLRGDDLDALHDRAARLASYVCTHSGATPPLPDWF